MYRITLTQDERSAFDWVGHRYCAGNVASLLLDCIPADSAWDDEGEIAFVVPENVAWEIRDLAEQEEYAWPCFADDLKAKLNTFCQSIV